MALPAEPARPPVSRLGDHPLEVFAWARRIPRSPLRDVVYTLIFNAGIAAMFTLFALPFTDAVAWGRIAWANLVIANCIGFVVHGEFAILEWATGRRCYAWSFWPRALVFSGLPIIGVVVGYYIAFELIDWRSGRRAIFSLAGMVGVVAVSILISSILAVILSAREKMAKAEAAYEAERARVASLIDAEPAAARRMLDKLIVLLRASAAGDPDGRSTLGEQLAHMRAYLEVLAMRMGPRLRWSIDAPDALAGRELPPAILQPLVENAIKHGIEPALDGGALAIAARDDQGRTVIEVADTGVGFGAAATAPLGGSTGLGLANLRARLAALYGNEARVTIAENAPSGVRVAVSLPPGGFR